MPGNLQKLYTPEQVADLLQVNVITVHRWLRSGQLRGYKLGRKLWRIDSEYLEDFLTSRLREVVRIAST